MMGIHHHQPMAICIAETKLRQDHKTLDCVSPAMNVVDCDFVTSHDILRLRSTMTVPDAILYGP